MVSQRAAVRSVRAREAAVGLGKIISALPFIWMVIGFIAAFQHFRAAGGPLTCADFGDVAMMIVSGPLNYLGFSPHFSGCDLPVSR
ncbi:hypothetical protein [Nocardia panacis]|uniref:hypothetical protein n=1 Tax=Nocardia panacis TaxID=2340916 RepID=UPI0013150DD8|nr:hypothetical protein [Nocardia panacis]